MLFGGLKMDFGGKLADRQVRRPKKISGEGMS
jgi:hypothetical protein